jgi:DNA-binding NtrC family response regulator
MSESNAPLVCLVEDDPIMGESLCVRFELEGFGLDWHRRAGEALAAIGRRPYAVVISDIRLPDLGGDELFARLKERHSVLPPFVFITAFGAIDRAVQLLKSGAADYITKPFDLDELVEKVRSLARLSAARRPDLAPALGVSQAMRRIEEMLPRLAKHAATVLFTGESGVGKEYVAKALDRLARESEQCPFVAVNCGAITETLFEAELFGHEKGAFTGATRARKGYFEQAHCGTLFLDEISELPPPMQVKLLRAIQERRIVRVGGEAPIDVNLRLFCATNRDLKEMVERGLFREDLFYRINVLQIRIPPLRERKQDILWFAGKFLDEFAAEHGGERRTLRPDAEQALLDHPWPGNIRELGHCIQRACILSPERSLGAEAFFGAATGASPPPGAAGTLSGYLQERERDFIVQALARHDWHIARTAEHLGISRKNLWEKMKKLAIQEPAREPSMDATRAD